MKDINKPLIVRNGKRTTSINRTKNKQLKKTTLLINTQHNDLVGQLFRSLNTNKSNSI